MEWPINQVATAVCCAKADLALAIGWRNCLGCAEDTSASRTEFDYRREGSSAPVGDFHVPCLSLNWDLHCLACLSALAARESDLGSTGATRVLLVFEALLRYVFQAWLVAPPSFN